MAWQSEHVSTNFNLRILAGLDGKKKIQMPVPEHEMAPNQIDNLYCNTSTHSAFAPWPPVAEGSMLQQTKRERASRYGCPPVETIG